MTKSCGCGDIVGSLGVSCKLLILDFALLAEEMERTMGDLRPDDWENGIQVSKFCSFFAILGIVF